VTDTRSAAGHIAAPALFGLLTAQFVGQANATLVMTAAPAMIRDVQGNNFDYTWVLTSTILTMTASSPIWSRLSDGRSPKTLLQLSLAIFVVGSLVAGTASTSAQLIVGRAIQGVGVGGPVALVQVIIALLVAPRHRGRYTAWLSAVQLVAMLGGPFIGGLLVETPFLGWRGCFLAGIPLAILASVAVQVALRMAANRAALRMDMVGAALITCGLSAALIWISFQGTFFPLSSPVSIILGCCAVVLLAGAIFVELRTPDPILPLALLSNRTVGLSFAATVIVGGASFAVPMLMTQYLQNGRMLPPAMSGLIIAAMALGIVAASFAVGALAARTARLKAALVVGNAMMALTSSLLAMMSPETPLAWIVTLLLFQGAGFGATVQFFMLVAQNELPESQIGAGTGMFAFMRSFAGTLALTGFGTAFDSRVAQLRNEGISLASAHALGATQAFIPLAALLLIGLVVVAAIPRIHLRSTLTIDHPPFPEDDQTGT
jgi:MFS family permease